MLLLRSLFKLDTSVCSVSAKLSRICRKHSVLSGGTHQCSCNCVRCRASALTDVALLAGACVISDKHSAETAVQAVSALLAADVLPYTQSIATRNCQRAAVLIGGGVQCLLSGHVGLAIWPRLRFTRQKTLSICITNRSNLMKEECKFSSKTPRCAYAAMKLVTAAM
jgi:hypothetical protein